MITYYYLNKVNFSSLNETDNYLLYKWVHIGIYSAYNFFYKSRNSTNCPLTSHNCPETCFRIINFTIDVIKVKQNHIIIVSAIEVLFWNCKPPHFSIYTKNIKNLKVRTHILCLSLLSIWSVVKHYWELIRYVGNISSGLGHLAPSSP